MVHHANMGAEEAVAVRRTKATGPSLPPVPSRCLACLACFVLRSPCVRMPEHRVFWRRFLVRMQNRFFHPPPSSVHPPRLRRPPRCAAVPQPFSLPALCVSAFVRSFCRTNPFHNPQKFRHHSVFCNFSTSAPRKTNPFHSSRFRFQVSHETARKTKEHPSTHKNTFFCWGGGDALCQSPTSVLRSNEIQANKG